MRELLPGEDAVKNSLRFFGAEKREHKTNAENTLRLTPFSFRCAKNLSE